MRTIAQASGAAPEVKEVAATALAVVSTKQYDLNWGEEPAWIYRKAFDAMLSFYGDSAMPSDDNYPAYAAGAWAAEAMACGTANTCGARTEDDRTHSTATTSTGTGSYASAKQTQTLAASGATGPPARAALSAVVVALVCMALHLA